LAVGSRGLPVAGSKISEALCDSFSVICLLVPTLAENFYVLAIFWLLALSWTMK